MTAGHGLLRFARNDRIFGVATGRVETRLDHVASKVAALDTKLDGPDSKVAALDSRVDAVHQSLGARPDRAVAQAATNLQITLAALQDKPR